MRIYSTAILAVAAVVSYILGPLGVRGLTMMRANRSYVDAHEDIPEGKLRTARDATVGEERASLPSETFGLIQRAADTVRTEILSKLHATPDKMLATSAWSDLQRIDDCVVTRYASALAGNPEQRELVMTMLSREPDGLRNVMYLVRTFDTKHSETILMVGPGGLRTEDIDKYFAANGPIQTLYPASLHTFQKYVEESNQIFKTGPTLLRFLEIVYGGFAKLAPALAIAKKSQISEVGATHLQSEMLTIWLNEGRSIDDVFGYLKLFEMETSDLVYDKLDALYQYIALYNKKKKDDTPDVNILAYIRQKLDNGEFARMTANAEEKIEFPDCFLTYLGEQWKDEGKPLLDIAEQFFAAGMDVRKVLDWMSTECGGEANLAKILTHLTKDITSRERADFWMKTMVERWVDDKKDLDTVYDLLDLPDFAKGVDGESNLPYMYMFIVRTTRGHNGIYSQRVAQKLKDARARRSKV